MKHRKLTFQFILVLLTAAIPCLNWAQTSNGILVGSVLDPSDAVVPKAIVSAVSAQNGAMHETQTDAVGTYRLESLQPGTYTVTITAPGFKTLTVTRVVINGSLATTINGKLELAAAEEVIEVQATALQAIDTQSGQLGGNISLQEVTQLPYTSFNPAELALTLPGVHDVPSGQGAVNASVTEGIGFSVNGTRPRANNFLIEGQDDNDYFNGGQAYSPTNVGAVQEVAVLTNSYSAEFGRGGGSVTNYIYKSGTNNFHGDLWEVNQNSALAAIPAEVEVANPVTKNPYYNENTFGFDFGGPIKKDKLFFFGTVQGDLTHQAVTGPLFALPTAAGIATLQSLEPNPNIALFLKAIGSLESPGLNGVTDIALGLDPAGNLRPSVEVGDFQLQNVNTITTGTDWNARMDWQISVRNRLTGSVTGDTYTLTPDTFTNASALPGFQTKQSAPTRIYRGEWVRTISSKLLNELRVSYTSADATFPLTPATAANPLSSMPFIEFGTDINFPSIGVDSNFPQGRTHHTVQVQEALSYSAGTQTIKAGVDLTWLKLHDILGLNTRGTIVYNLGTDATTGNTYTSLGDFIDDMTGQDPGTISVGFGNPNINASATIFAPYIQDTWRIKSNLAMDLGLRYEYWGPLGNALSFPAFDTSQGFGVPNITLAMETANPLAFESAFSFKQIPDKRNFAPRIGLAYSPHWGKLLFGDGKTVLRAGYGIFYDGLFSSIIDQSDHTQPNTFGGILPPQVNRGTSNASTTGIASITANPNPSLLITSMASNLHNPMTQQWNADVQRELPLGLLLTLAYVGTRGEHLFANTEYDPQVNYSFMSPVFGNIGVRTNSADSRYNSGQIEVERRLSSLTLRASYAYSKFEDDASDVNTVGATNTVLLASFAQVLTDQHSDWGPSIFDQRHRFSIAYVWAAPYFHHNAFLRAVTDQWQWSGIASIESGTPNTVEVGFDNIGDGRVNARPDLANPAAPLTSLGIDGPDVGLAPGTYDFLCVLSGSTTCTPEPYNTFHFVVPNTRPGTVGRNSLFGPGQVYFDTSIQRDFPIHFGKLDSQRISFRAEFFNAFNHPNLFTPSYTMTDPNYDNTAITINGGRKIKFWLKYTF
jgi:hypothetical protein